MTTPTWGEATIFSMPNAKKDVCQRLSDTLMLLGTVITMAGVLALIFLLVWL